MNSNDNFQYIHSLFMWRNINRHFRRYRLSFTLLTDKEDIFNINPMQEINGTLFKKIKIRRVNLENLTNYFTERLKDTKYHGVIFSKTSQVLTSSVVWRCLSMCFHFKSSVLTLPIGRVLSENSRAGVVCASVRSLPLKLYSFNDLDLL